MSTITFPNLNLEFNLSRIAVTIGNIQIYWYAIFYVLAFLSGILLFKKKDNKFDIKFWDILELLIYLIPISIICARLYYVICNLGHYLSDPIQILNTRSRRHGNLRRDDWRSINLYCILQEKEN